METLAGRVLIKGDEDQLNRLIAVEPPPPVKLDKRVLACDPRRGPDGQIQLGQLVS